MTAHEQAFLSAVVPGALASQQQYGIPASITIAQAILESGWGQHMPPGSNNYFGIKAAHDAAPDMYVEALTPEYIRGKLEHLEQPFAKYADAAGSFLAHARLLATASRYQPAMAQTRNPRLFATQLRRCGYSTNPTYENTLMQLVHEFDLTQYDLAPVSVA